MTYARATISPDDLWAHGELLGPDKEIEGYDTFRLDDEQMIRAGEARLWVNVEDLAAVLFGGHPARGIAPWRAVEAACRLAPIAGGSDAPTEITVTVSTSACRLVTQSDGPFAFKKWSEYATRSAAWRAARRLVAGESNAVTMRHWGHLLPDQYAVTVVDGGRED